MRRVLAVATSAALAFATVNASAQEPGAEDAGVSDRVEELERRGYGETASSGAVLRNAK